MKDTKKDATARKATARDRWLADQKARYNRVATANEALRQSIQKLRSDRQR